MRANCGERGRCYRKCSQPRLSPQPSPFTHLALKTEAAEARNHAVLAANAGHTFFILAVEDRSQNDPQLTSTHKLPSASTLDQSTATVIILIHFAAHVRHCGADAREQKEHRSTTHPLPANILKHAARRGHQAVHHLLAATGSSSVDTNDAGKEVTEAEASRKAVESEAERLRRHTAAGNRSFAVHMEKRRAALTMCSTPMSRVSSLTRSVKSTPHTSLFLCSEHALIVAQHTAWLMKQGRRAQKFISPY